jgi:dienelactone hydrolase
MQRLDVKFASGRDTCAASLYLPAAQGPSPVVVLAHGWTGVREQRLDAHAERFAAAGLAALVFDYRHFGASSGQPRQLLDIKRQLADWAAAVASVRARPELDRGRAQGPSNGASRGRHGQSPTRLLFDTSSGSRPQTT